MVFNKRVTAAVAAALAAVMSGAPGYACGTFNVKAIDGTVISARSMEFGYDVKSDLVLIPRGTEFASPTPAGGKGMTWKTRYGIAGVTVAGDQNLIVDGMNEAGLAISGLWYDGLAWQDVTKKNDKDAISHVRIGTWLLGSFSTVEEVKAALAKVKIFGEFVPLLKSVPPMHMALTDATGAAIVIEPANGTVKVYDNPVGVMTNAPAFPWMLENLRNYTGMSNRVAPAAAFGALSLKPTGHGSGMFGLPGDLTPPARFARLAVTLKFADQAADTLGALNLAQHVLNSVDITRGMAADYDEAGKLLASETTEWAVLRDLTHGALYFRTYENQNLRKIDLKKVNFGDGKLRRLPIHGAAEVITDVTPAD